MKAEGDIAPLLPDVNARWRSPRTNTILLRKTFPTLQGEWPFCGRRSLFVRMGGCNLGDKETACFDCDTDFRISESREISIRELVDRIITETNGETDWLIVLSGGEPGLQPALGKVIEVMPEYEFQYESNGMFELENHFHNVHTVISPKCPYLAPEWPSFESYERNLTERTYFRFVVEDVPGSPYQSVPPWALSSSGPFQLVRLLHRAAVSGWTKRKPGSNAQFLLDPGMDLEQTFKNWRLAHRLALQHGFTQSFQTHIVAGFE